MIMEPRCRQRIGRSRRASHPPGDVIEPTEPGWTAPRPLSRGGHRTLSGQQVLEVAGVDQRIVEIDEDL